MCMKTPKAPKPTPPRPAPQRDEQRAATQDARRRTRDQSGMYGNVFTSALGDVGYGQNVAALGA